MRPSLIINKVECCHKKKIKKIKKVTFSIRISSLVCLVRWTFKVIIIIIFLKSSIFFPMFFFFLRRFLSKTLVNQTPSRNYYTQEEEEKEKKKLKEKMMMQEEEEVVMVSSPVDAGITCWGLRSGKEHLRHRSCTSPPHGLVSIGGRFLASSQLRNSPSSSTASILYWSWNKVHHSPFLSSVLLFLLEIIYK